MEPPHHARTQLYEEVEVKMSKSSLNKKPFFKKITCPPSSPLVVLRFIEFFSRPNIDKLMRTL